MNFTKKILHITFLGTGTSQGIPMIASNDPVCLSTDFKDKRLRSSILISWDNVSYTIDCGPDFRQQMLRENVQLIQGVFFTHEHADHIGGLDDLRPFCYKLGEMKIYLSNRVLTSLEKRFEYIFSTENRYPGAPTVNPILVDDASFLVDDLTITPIKVMHGNLPITAYRFQDFAYLTDVKSIEASEKEKLRNLDVLVVNALRIQEHPTHFNLQEALDFVKEIKPKRTYFTHISHKLGFHKEVSEQLPKNVFLAYDGLKITV
ncbi:MBL fold metallo-hydrolase [Polaribacter reichenbachii]|uniref:MBL fold metallo-hydrolase n=1 Tax=Polaribacter reichenbachii TaxID=996801 RepID=A0A1B8TPL6_9FLAO|nr:MBL fold metallo-hydrolase [Polaribacter reichenbachii]APZ46922.1 MBL fold metallo-hydrolase [Polaribacter reichenbachii]AUC17565.1 MBL fold metallo-hydrolase [Polaribacter reichenbachii]OBY61562.1 MBL fold metallo-hydrolase [Polaribacter reichenbachii]